MKLAFADPRNLTVSPHNMHYGRPEPDTADIRPSIRQRGVMLTLLVQEKVENGAVLPGHFEVVAGRRRMYAAQAEIAAGVEIDPVPIGILEAGDDAAAIEASLLENLARLPPEEVSRWETFAKLIRKGRTAEEIAVTFDLTDVVVRRTLALGNLLPRIRHMYRREQLDVASVRALTLATKAQQRDWLALVDDPDQRAPTGQALKTWLFGAAPIPTKHALFSLDDYPGQIIADLFGEDSYFTDPSLFWTHQNKALAAKREALLSEGWSGVEVLEAGKSFDRSRHQRVSKAKGGKVFLTANLRGEVTIHEGWLSDKEARRAEAAARRQASNGGEGQALAAPNVRPEVTSAQQTYIDLHRQAAVRAVLLDHPGAALRLLVAHAVAGSALWRVQADPQRGASGAMALSLEASPAQAVFRKQRAAAAATLQLDAERDLVGQRHPGGAAALFAKLLTLPDADILALAAVVMGETLAAGSVEVEAAGLHLKVDTGAFWSPDEAFFDLIRDREAINAILREVGGKKVADGNVSEKIKTQKAILRDCLEGRGDRPKAPKWTPRWLTFPAGGYTKRPFATAERDKALAPLLRRVRAPKASGTVPAVTLTAEPNPALLVAD